MTAAKGKRYLLGEGYPWYSSSEINGRRESGYNGVSLFKDQNGYRTLCKPNGEFLTNEWRRQELKIKWGAYTKVRLWIEKVPVRRKGGKKK